MRNRQLTKAKKVAKQVEIKENTVKREQEVQDRLTALGTHVFEDTQDLLLPLKGSTFKAIKSGVEDVLEQELIFSPSGQPLGFTKKGAILSDLLRLLEDFKYSQIKEGNCGRAMRPLQPSDLGEEE